MVIVGKCDLKEGKEKDTTEEDKTKPNDQDRTVGGDCKTTDKGASPIMIQLAEQETDTRPCTDCG